MSIEKHDENLLSDITTKLYCVDEWCLPIMTFKITSEGGSGNTYEGITAQELLRYKDGATNAGVSNSATYYNNAVVGPDSDGYYSVDYSKINVIFKTI
tara:strand:+ start:1209 stop:1502 length:294 start_codon:yes stop_codon:yes gene_type:complete